MRIKHFLRSIKETEGTTREVELSKVMVAQSIYTAKEKPL